MPQQGLSDVSLTLLSSTIEVIDVKASPFHTSATESALPVNVLAGDALKKPLSIYYGFFIAASEITLRIIRICA